MNILLDTNAFIWLIGPKYKARLGDKARELINQATVVYVSSVSVSEIHIKSMLGKLPPLAGISDTIASSKLAELDYTNTHADALTKFPMLKKHDPFDRMLLAQAYADNLILLTSDKVLSGLNLSFVIAV